MIIDLSQHIIPIISILAAGGGLLVFIARNALWLGQTTRRLDDQERRIAEGERKFERVLTKLEALADAINAHQLGIAQSISQIKLEVRDEVGKHLERCLGVRDNNYPPRVP